MMKNPPLEGLAAAGLYLFAFSLTFWPLADLTMNVWPLQLGNVQWRYGAAGLLSAFLQTPMLGVVLALATAWYAGHRRVLAVVGGILIVAAVALLGIMVAFALDLLQVRGSRPPESLPAMMAGGAVSVAKYAFSALALGLMGMGALRMKGDAGPAPKAEPKRVVPRPTTKEIPKV